jgi:SPP1 gp7 family putative phage head morphogenesis protein
MPNKAYWKKRQEDLQLGLMNNAENYTAEIENGYKTAMKEMEKQISVWYQRFADNNQVDMVTARRMLTNGEMQELKWDVETYIEYAEKNAIDPLWEKELENASARVHISRLEALKLQTRQQLEQLYGNRNAELTELIGSTYTESLYKNGYENFIRTGIETHFDTIDKYKLNQVLSNPWTTDGVNFSNRLWSNKQQLIRTLNSEFIRAFSMGETPDNLARAISKKLGSDMRATKRLVMTESAYFATKGQQDCYKELGVEEYEIVGTLDSITCDECGGYDGKHFPREDMQAGINAPPFHPNCRCTTIPYFDDEFTEGEERAARGEDGKTEYVDDMTYEEWKAEYVDNTTKSDIMKIEGKHTKLSDNYEVLNPMNAETYLKMKQGVERQGYTVIAATTEDDINYLKAFGAEAISDEYGIMHMGDVPSASAFFEEVIHLTQMKKYGVPDSADFVERTAREIAANKMLLKNAKAYGFTAEDVKEIESNLAKWENDFERKVGVSYEKSEYDRGI